jgi:hypothetical protein
VLCGRSIHQLGAMWEKYTSFGCMPEKTTSTRLKDNLSMTKENPSMENVSLIEREC